MSDKTTIQVDTEIRDQLDKLAARKQPLNDVIKALLEINKMSVDNAKELIELTGEKTLTEAIKAAIQFTLLHDKYSVQEALKP